MSGIFTEPDKLDKALARSESGRDELIEELVEFAQSVSRGDCDCPSSDECAMLGDMWRCHSCSAKDVIRKAEREGYGQTPEDAA